MFTPDQLIEQLSTVASPSIAGVGDNVLDTYLHEDLSYPGGNALNVAVYSKLFFQAKSGFIGVMGTDRFADHLRAVLDATHVDYARSRRMIGSNGMAFVALDDDGDRRFVGSNWGGVQNEVRLRLNHHDFAYLEEFNRVHTSVYSAIDGELGNLRERGIRVSYDYSNDARPETIVHSAEHVDVGFFSGGGLSEGEVRALADFALESGMQRVVVTLGAQGSRAFESGASAAVGIFPVEALDALGAGDAFITGFLAATEQGSELDDAMNIAAMTGALACTYRGAFGYAVDAGDDARAQLLRRID